jgi:hypothetical protein
VGEISAVLAILAEFFIVLNDLSKRIFDWCGLRCFDFLSNNSQFKIKYIDCIKELVVLRFFLYNMVVVGN